MEQPLPIKYRPQRFEDIIGQQITSKILSELIKRNISRHIILHGQYGASKTTFARIYARALNCKNITQSGSPCNKCNNCKDFLEGKFADYVEIDGTRSGRIDTIKDLVEISTTPPLYGDYRVIVVDEAQGLSGAAWDCLLKIIEEPPHFLTFIFTTTEINKIRSSIISRCQSLKVHLLDAKDSLNYLKRVCGNEGLEYQESALEAIVRLSRGHARDLLKNLEKTTLYGDITLDNVLTCFQELDQRNTIKAIELLFKDYRDFINFDRTWETHPQDKLDKIKEIFLYLFYTKVQKISVEKPLGITDDQLEGIWHNIENNVRRNKGSLEISIDNLLNLLVPMEAKSQISFELCIYRVYSALNSIDFKISSKSSVPTGNMIKKISVRKRGREFVGDYVVPNSVQTENIINKKQKLEQFGFKRK